MDNPNRIPNAYMIFFKEGVPGTVVMSVVSDLQTNYPEAEIQHVWHRLEPRGFAVGNLPEVALQGLRRNSQVDHISADVWGAAGKVDLR